MKRVLKENLFFICICVAMSIYYLYRLFAITPWYDEVYTYLSFIDKGFFFSITHWPLPNNHILFSALSSFFRPAGIYIALRGVSYISAVGTLIILYMFLKQIFGKRIAAVGIMLYTILNSVNVLAIQGRGYSFATFCFTLSIYSVYQIVFNNEKKEKKKRFYCLFSLALFMGLYTLVSSVYWVVTICICGGLILLIQRRYGDFWKLVSYSLLAAIITFGAYSVVWLAIGSNMLIDNWGMYAQESHVSMIIREPLLCLVEGFKLMANNPFMQGIDSRSVFLNDFIYFGKSVLFSFFQLQSNFLWYMFVAIVLILCGVFVVVAVRRIRRKEEIHSERADLALVLSGVGFLTIFLVLYVQCAYPFTRVFSFMGILFVIQFCLFIFWIQKLIEQRFHGYRIGRIACGLIAVGCILTLANPRYNEEYSILDYNAYDAIKNIEWDGIDSYLASDIYAKQQIQYHCILGKDLFLEEDTEDPHVIFVKKNVQFEEWANLPFGADSYGLEQRAVLYENDEYIVYGN